MLFRSGTGEFPPIVPDNFAWNAFLDGETTLPSGYNTAVNFGIDLEFANGAVINVNNHYERDDDLKFDNGILFEGEEGRIFVKRSKLTGKPVEELTEADNKELDEAILKLDRKSTRLNSSHTDISRMPSSA